MQGEAIDAWQKLVAECNTMAKVETKITNLLQQIDVNMSESCNQAIQWVSLLEKYQSESNELLKSLNVWSKVFNTFVHEEKENQVVDDNVFVSVPRSVHNTPATPFKKDNKSLLQRMMRMNATPQNMESPDSDGNVSFIGSPPVTLPFAKPVLNEIHESPLTSIPCTPGSISERTRQLLHPIVTPSSGSSGCFNQPSWMLKSAHQTPQSEESPITDPPSWIQKSTQRARSYLLDNDEKIDSFSPATVFDEQGRLSIKRSHSAFNFRHDHLHDTPLSIASLDLASPSFLRRRDFDQEIEGLDLAFNLTLLSTESNGAMELNDATAYSNIERSGPKEIDLNEFPDAFQTETGSEQLFLMYSVFQNTTPLSVEQIKEKLGPDFDHDRCQLFLGLLERKKYISKETSHDGVHLWSLLIN